MRRKDTMRREEGLRLAAEIRGRRRSEPIKDHQESPGVATGPRTTLCWHGREAKWQCQCHTRGGSPPQRISHISQTSKVDNGGIGEHLPHLPQWQHKKDKEVLQHLAYLQHLQHRHHTSLSAIRGCSTSPTSPALATHTSVSPSSSYPNHVHI